MLLDFAKVFTFLIITTLGAQYVSSVPVDSDDEVDCTYDNCPAVSPDKVNVHIISHTHDDVGWLKTVDQYFYGNRNGIQNAGVQYILDSVIDALRHDKSRRFIYVETAFFWRWWRQQSDFTRHLVQNLVRSGQLEFIGGGWSMNDEGATHYNAIIDNMSVGLKLLNDTFGKCGKPKVAWQIDPFGHSREQASLFAQMGYDGLFFGRLDFRDMRKRKNTKTMEVVWKGSDNLGDEANLFTGVLPNLYQPPAGFCFDILCSDSPIMDDKRMEDYNVPLKVAQFMKHVKRQSQWYRTNNIVMTMGNDFNYQNANTWFKNLDKLIYHVNKMHKNVNVFYSTPSCYLYSLNKADLKWKVKEQDFLPYASDPHAYWSGYFTSRPTFKGLIRYSNNLLQVCKQLDAIARLGPMDNSDTTTLRHAMAVVQHHDAVTGTAKQHVTDDYYKRLYEGIEACQMVLSDSYKKLMLKSKDDPIPASHKFCNLQNISQCAFTESNSKFSLTIYNPIARPVDKYIRLPITGGTYNVKDNRGVTVDTQTVPIPASVSKIPGRVSDAKFELVFNVKFPALGYITYQVTKTNEVNQKSSEGVLVDGKDAVIKNQVFSLTIDGSDGMVKSMKNLQDGVEIDLRQSFYWYWGHSHVRKSDRASGAYIFRPNGTHPYYISKKAVSRVITGPVVQEVHQEFNSWVSQVIRLYKYDSQVEFEWLVGSIPVNDKVGKEIITRFDTNIKSTESFYTDSNGREILKRIRNKRPDYKLTGEEPTAQNFFPVNSRIYIKDQKRQFTVLTDRSQAGSSLYSGSLELMVHRRLLYDDGFGVDEALNEMAFGKGLVARGKHYVQLWSVKKASVMHRYSGLSIFMSPWLSFSNNQPSSSNHRLEFSGLKRPLPPNVHLLTLEQWKAGGILIRLEHFFERTDDPSGKLSRPAVVSLKDLFTTFRVVSATEMSLDGVHLLSDKKRLKWNTENNPNPKDDRRTEPLKIDQIKLNPMQIRTFVLKVATLN